jgi:hypothetical protein
MPTILRRLPFYPDKTSVRIPDGPAIEIMRDQIVVWVSILPSTQTEWPASAQRFPALLDLGYNGFFLLREDHVVQWAKVSLDEETFPFLGTFNAYGHDIAAFQGDIWLHPNVAGFRDQIGDAPPLRLDMIGGIVVAPASAQRFRLPLLGLSALRKNRLRLLVNGEKKHISLRTALA